MLQFEQYGVTPAPPDRLWGLVGDLGQLPRWTDADAVEDVPDGPYAVKDTFVTVSDDRRLDWMLITVADRLLEAKTQLPRGRLGIGMRVAPDPVGSRLILACLYDPGGSRLRARLVELPALRRRFDRWIHRALTSL